MLSLACILLLYFFEPRVLFRLNVPAKLELEPIVPGSLAAGCRALLRSELEAHFIGS